MPTWPGQRPPPVSRVSWYQAFLCCPFPAPHAHRSPQRQRSGRASSASCDRGEATARGGQVPAERDNIRDHPVGGVWDLITRVFAVCGGWFDLKAGTWTSWQAGDPVSQPVSLFPFN